MSDFKIRFRDQQTGRQVEVDAQQVKGSWSSKTTEKSFEQSSVGDGQVDVMVKEDRWNWQYNRHLGVNTNQLSAEDAQALKQALENPNAANLRVFDVMGGRERQLKGLSVLKTDAAGELRETTPNIDNTGTRRPVQITPSGNIATPNGQEPVTLQQKGDGLFRAASLIDDVKDNLFDSIQTPLPLKEKMFNNLAEARNSVAPGQSLPAGMDETQALQLRSSAATTALELMTSKQNTNNDFKAQVLEQYTGWISQETNPLLKDSMIFNLHRLKGSLPASLQPQIENLRETSAPTKPPYEKWFADGNKTVNVDWSVGVGEGFLEDNVAHLKQKGFQVVEQRNGYPIMEKTVNKNGQETTFRIDFRPHNRNMFEKMGDDKTHVSIYSGHSNWGRNVREALSNSPQSSGDGKLMMTNLCVGKGELQQMRDKYPDSHLITTYNSGYFRPGNDAEWHYAVDALFDGIASRGGYESIAENTRKSNPWTWTHRREEGIDNNYIFPTDLEHRRQALDRDHDGQADVFDRMVNFNSFDVKTDTTREFKAIEPHRDTDSLVGTKIHFAAMSTNRISIYNELLHDRNGKAEVVPAGYHDPQPGETGLFRFTRNDNGLVEMSMNANYAHMSEEALRMAAAYEYSQYKSAEPGWPLQNRTDNVLQSLVFASQSLNTDSGYRDREVWTEFLSAYNLPNISLSDVASVREVDHHWYSGSEGSVPALRNKLAPDVLSQLAEDNRGVLQQP